MVVVLFIIIIIIVLSSSSCERKTVKTVANVHLLYPRLQEYITVSDVVTGIGVITLVYYPSLVFLAWFKMTNFSISASRYGISLRGNLSDAKKRKGNHEMANCEFVDRIIAKKMVRFVGDSNPGLSGSLLDMTAPYTLWGERVRTGRKDGNGNLQPPICRCRQRMDKIWKSKNSH